MQYLWRRDIMDQGHEKLLKITGADNGAIES